MLYHFPACSPLHLRHPLYSPFSCSHVVCISESYFLCPRFVFTHKFLRVLIFITRQQACIQIAAAIYTQARLRTSLFCFLLYQLSLWWVKYRAQPEAINSWKHAGRNAPWQAETSWGEKVKPRKPAWNQAFLWLSICGCQVRNKNFCKKISPTRLSIGSEPIWAL